MRRTGSIEAVRLVELFQLQSDDGPCLDCYRSGQPVNSPDLAVPGRWPRVTALAAERGFRSAHAVPMRLRGLTIGALNLFGATAGALPPADLRVARPGRRRHHHDLARPRRGRPAGPGPSASGRPEATVEVATGVLAEVGTLDMGEAFTRLRDHAHSTDQPLTELARRLVTRQAGAEVLGLTDH